MAKAKTKVYTIYIAADPNEKNAKKIQYERFQKDGQTVEVPIGKFVDVPDWVAIRAKEIGLIPDYQVREVDA